MISKKHKAIFIHIHKTAGSSIEMKLGLYNKIEYGAQDHRKIRDLEEITNRKANFLHALHFYRHQNFSKGLSYFKRAVYPEITQREYKSFYKFTFVRNSWDRVYSWYHNVIRDEVQLYHHKISAN